MLRFCSSFSFLSLFFLFILIITKSKKAKAWTINNIINTVLSHASLPLFSAFFFIHSSPILYSIQLQHFNPLGNRNPNFAYNFKPKFQSKGDENQRENHTKNNTKNSFFHHCYKNSKINHTLSKLHFSKTKSLQTPSVTETIKKNTKKSSRKSYPKLKNCQEKVRINHPN
jgi:energy-coupling factor transporter transmembrane protein EcfT